MWGALERYWKPICEKREGARRRFGTLHLAQAQSNRGRRGRKRDFPDAERLVKRLVARELTLRFVPDAEQRLWRAVRTRCGFINVALVDHAGYAISLSKRWSVEKPSGWLKQIGSLKKVKLRGLAMVDWLFVFSCAAFNLIRTRNCGRRAREEATYPTFGCQHDIRGQIGSSNHNPERTLFRMIHSCVKGFSTSS